MKNLSTYIAFIAIICLLSSMQLFSQTNGHSQMIKDKLVGNVFGTVVDEQTSKPIKDAEVLLLNEPVPGDSSNEIIHTNKGDVVLTAFESAIRSGKTDKRGEFLINFVPTPLPFKCYTILVRAAEYNSFLVNQAKVFPGACMSLGLDCKLKKGAEKAILFNGNDNDAPLKYRNEKPIQLKINRPEGMGLQSMNGLKYTIFATREGLVGYTTANGHVIVPNDRFVALPSSRALNSDDQTFDFVVRLTYKSRTVDAPVWDLGPWNIKDDYWNPSEIREMWQDLPQGIPEAQAAYYDGYNNGLDQYGRVVTLPNGIDLADGTFWDDLQMSDNDWINVEYLWTTETTDDLYLQNQTITSTQIFEAKNNIYAGRNVTPDEPIGDFNIASGANVTFRAGNEIVLEDGFNAKNSSEFLAEISSNFMTSEILKTQHLLARGKNSN